VLLSSSYTGFGHVRLNDDARELEQLMQYLQEEGSQALGIVGHSTGCQDAVYYLKQHHAQVQQHTSHTHSLAQRASDRGDLFP
jgi:triacylglycerol esterase/lipase EstA (alpha/beta hydrolase family)